MGFNLFDQPLDIDQHAEETGEEIAEGAVGPNEVILIALSEAEAERVEGDPYALAFLSRPSYQKAADGKDQGGEITTELRQRYLIWKSLGR